MKRFGLVFLFLVVAGAISPVNGQVTFTVAENEYGDIVGPSSDVFAYPSAVVEVANGLTTPWTLTCEQVIISWAMTPEGVPFMSVTYKTVAMDAGSGTQSADIGELFFKTPPQVRHGNWDSSHMYAIRWTLQVSGQSPIEKWAVWQAQ